MSKVYSCWAFTENQNEKRDSNRDFYEKNKDKIKFKFTGSGYARSKYLLLENNENLTDDEVACIIDDGNLCFGYRREGNTFVIYTD